MKLRRLTNNSSLIFYRVVQLLSVMFLVFVVLAFLSFQTRSGQNFGNNETNSLKHETVIKIGEYNVVVEIADTDQERARGLSGKTFLGEEEGMLFTFITKTQPAFWMKDMKIALDMIWIADGKIIFINENVHPPATNTPTKNLELYRPPEPVDYVLEVNAGFSQKRGIKAGDSIEINL